MVSFILGSFEGKCYSFVRNLDWFYFMVGEMMFLVKMSIVKFLGFLDGVLFLIVCIILF